jgi:integrase
MPRLNGKVPTYRLHRASGQAIVTLNGRDHYLGPHGTQASRMQYDRLVCEWLTVASYRRAIERGCDMAFPLPEHLARQKVRASRGSRWETATEWEARLGAEGWKQLKAWRRAHRWHPHQLRHSAGTHLRREFGIEVARIILGHRSISMTELYAEIDDTKAKQVMRKIG